MANQQVFFLISGIIFGLVALFHALRLVLRWRVDLRSQEIPMWLSGIGFVASAGLCFWAFWLLL
jgi:H+/Cl- antiporter ClcA